MKRPILFRGKRIDNGEWVEGGIFENLIITAVSSYTDFDEVIPDSVGQFTGLTDKNGVKIFEGDIVKDSGERHLLVGWSNKFASFIIDSKKWAFSHWFGEAVNDKDVEVIGNIHDNTELL